MRLLASFALLVLASTGRADMPAKPAAFAVEEVKDVAYRTGPDADPVRHKLDLYLPKGAKDYPVLFFVHGGTWRSGRKEMYGLLGQHFARLGIGTAVINYRLSPQVKHPDHAKDVAAAFAWVHGHIGEYGGRADRIFACGHSAGGHLVALLAADERYLKAEKLTTAAVRGVIALSGVYVITPVSLFRNAFGDDPLQCDDASPVTHARPGLPPFLLAFGDKDFLYLDRMAEVFAQALTRCGVAVTLKKMTERTHISIITSIVTGTDDPLAKLILDFVGKYAEVPQPK